MADERCHSLEGIYIAHSMMLCQAWQDQDRFGARVGFQGKVRAGVRVTVGAYCKVRVGFLQEFGDGVGKGWQAGTDTMGIRGQEGR